MTRISQDNTVLIWVINSKGELLCSEYNKDSMSKEDIKLKMKTGLKNIVSVKSELISNGHSSYGKVVCIDIDGNIFNID